MDQTERTILLRNEFEKAFQAKIKAAALTLVRTDREEKSIFSGTLLKVQSRLFVITCEHELPNVPNGKIWVVRESGSRQSHGFPQIVNRLRNENGRPDVALLELDPSVLSSYLMGYQPIGVEDIGDLDYSNSRHRVVILVGNAYTEAFHKKINESDFIGAVIECLYHDVVLPRDWPSPLAGDAPHDELNDMYVQPHGATEQNPREASPYFRVPYGLSGGGYWVNDSVPGELWSPSQIKLVGVQSSWDETAGCLHGVRSGSIKNLLRIEGLL